MSRSLVLKYLSVSDLVSALAQPQRIIRWRNWIFPACRTWLISTKSIAFLPKNLIIVPKFPKLVVSRSLVLKYLSVSDLVSGPLVQPHKINWVEELDFSHVQNLTYIHNKYCFFFGISKKFPISPNLEWVDLWCLNICLSRIWRVPWRSPPAIFRWRNWIFPMCRTWLISTTSIAFLVWCFWETPKPHTKNA